MRDASCSPLGWQLPPQDQAAAYTRCPRGPGALLKGPRPDAGRSEPRGGPGAPPRDLTRDGMGTTPNAILPLPATDARTDRRQRPGTPKYRLDRCLTVQLNT